jgi:hypothetical protein
MTNEYSPTPGTYEESVLLALRASTQGAASLRWIYARVQQLREGAGLPLNATFQATIRRTLQQSPLFWQDRPRSGIWALASKRGTANET